MLSNNMDGFMPQRTYSGRKILMGHCQSFTPIRMQKTTLMKRITFWIGLSQSFKPEEGISPLEMTVRLIIDSVY